MALLTVGDGRTVHYAISGSSGGRALVFHHGQPGAAFPWERMVSLASGHGWTTVMVSRPGYGQSDRLAGRVVADVAADIAAVLDELAVDDFVTLGWSGGGPHALACGALMEGRCRAVATVAGVAPFFEAADLDFTAGMGPENAEEFDALAGGDPDVESRIMETVAGLADVLAGDLAEGLGGLLSEPDRECLDDEDFAGYLAHMIRQSASNGHYGYLDDGLAFVSPWGFDPGALGVPVTVWIARHDLMVPPAHGDWLAAHVPGATRMVLEDEGHLSIFAGRLPEILDELAAAR